MNKQRIPEIYIEELAAYLTNIDLADIEDDNYDTQLAEALREKYEIPFEHFCELIEDLVPLVSVGQSSLTGKMYAGFADKPKKLWLVKTELPEEEMTDK